MIPVSVDAHQFVVVVPLHLLETDKGVLLLFSVHKHEDEAFL